MSDIMMQTQNAELHTGFFQPTVFTQTATRTKVLETAIAGMYFHIENDEERKTLRELTPGTELTLYRDTDNPVDEWAVSIYYGENDMLGYITRFKNETIARLMDCGKKFVAVVDEKRKENPDDKKKKAPTEKGLPISVYLEE